MKDTPLFRDTFALCGVLFEVLEAHGDHAPLRRRLYDGALRLLDLVTLAAGDFDRFDRLADADEESHALRPHLALAFELGLIDEACFLGFAEQMDSIGRQIGGWLKRLDARVVNSP